MSNNFFNYWGKRFIKDGLRAMKIVVGVGLSVCFYITLNLPIAILFFAWVLLESLIEKE